MALEPGRSPLISLEWMLANELPPVDWLVEPLFVHGGKTILSATWGAYKSWLTLDMLLHIAAGVPWLGFRVPKPRRVLYVDEEMAKDETWRRVVWLCRGRPVLQHAMEGFRMICQQGYRSDKAQHLKSCLVSWKYQPEVIWIETLRSTLMGSENDAEAVSRMWVGYNLFTADPEWKVSIGVNHHDTKPPQVLHKGDEQRHVRDRASGSGYILGGPDQGIHVELPDPEVPEVTMRHIKVRSGQRQGGKDGIRIQLQFGSDRCRVERLATKEEEDQIRNDLPHA